MDNVQSAIFLAVAVYVLVTIIAAKFIAKSAKVGVLKIIWEKPSFWIVFWPITICAIFFFGVLIALALSALTLYSD